MKIQKIPRVLWMQVSFLQVNQMLKSLLKDLGLTVQWQGNYEDWTELCQIWYDGRSGERLSLKNGQILSGMWIKKKNHPYGRGNWATVQNAAHSQSKINSLATWPGAEHSQPLCASCCAQIQTPLEATWGESSICMLRNLKCYFIHKATKFHC